MRYRDILGFSKKKAKKAVIPEQPKPSVADLLKEEFGDTINEGPAYEYAKYTKNIDKAWDNTKKAVMGLVKELHKKGLRKEALTIEKKYQASIRNFYHYFVEILDKLE